MKIAELLAEIFSYNCNVLLTALRSLVFGPFANESFRQRLIASAWKSVRRSLETLYVGEMVAFHTAFFMAASLQL